MPNLMAKLEQAKLEKRPLIGDGACGTILMSMGLTAGYAPELWNKEEPDKIISVHKRYIEAGSEAIITNSFGGNRLKLSMHNYGDQDQELSRLSAELARKAAGDKVIVLGDMGPTGQMMAPLGTISKKEMVEVFARQAQALAQGGADAIIIETMMDIEEAKAALEGARQSCSLPVIVSMNYNKVPDGFRTMMGQKVEDCVKILDEAGADVIASNCGLTAEEMLALVKIIRNLTSRWIMLQPNAGNPKVIEGKTVYEEDMKVMATKGKQLFEQGADFIGGCCGTNPEYINHLYEIFE